MDRSCLRHHICAKIYFCHRFDCFLKITSAGKGWRTKIMIHLLWCLHSIRRLSSIAINKLDWSSLTIDIHNYIPYHYNINKLYNNCSHPSSSTLSSTSLCSSRPASSQNSQAHQFCLHLSPIERWLHAHSGFSHWSLRISLKY